MSAGAVAVVEDAAGGIEFIEHFLQTLARGSRGGVFRVGCDELLGERCIAHVEEFARLIQLPAWLADVPVACELYEDPIARWSLLPAQLGGAKLRPSSQVSSGSFAPASSANVCRKSRKPTALSELETGVSRTRESSGISEVTRLQLPQSRLGTCATQTARSAPFGCASSFPGPHPDRRSVQSGCRRR